MADEDSSMQDGAPTQDDTPMRIETSSDSGSGSESEEEQVEWMVTAREKRSTAGNRLTSLLQQEEPDDELELLFAEADDDAGFEDAEADNSDVQMDSSDDDDDQGPVAGAEDLDGEKELQRQAKVEKAKKRKNDGIPIFKKKVKIDPTISQAPAPRPKKKSERASWIPTAEELPTRASQRGTTKQQKTALHAQMVDREFKRLKQLENMEKAAAKKKAAEKPAMTQEDRLREAARVEKANSKSLTRWEQAEQEREEEQKAKLAALSNRHLEGPVITWWSGLAQWAGGRLKQVGKTLMIEEPKEKPAASKKRKAAEMEAESEATPRSTPKPGEDISITSSDQPMRDTLPSNTGISAERPKPSDLPPAPQMNPARQEAGVSQSQSAPKPYMQPLIQPIPGPLQPPTQSPLQPPLQPQTLARPLKAPSHPPFILAPPQGWLHTPQPPPPPPPSRAALDGSAPVPGLGYNIQINPQIPRITPNSTASSYAQPSSQPDIPPLPPPPPAHETTSRNLLILANFDEVAIKNKDIQTQILFGRKFLKASKPKSHSLCAITSQPARYRDPQTGLAYYNLFAYREIQRLKRGEYKWSALVGAYVGSGARAANGVPGRFLTIKKE